MNHFEKPISFIATTKAIASRRFYEGVLGLTCLSDDPYALVFKLGATTLRVQKVETLKESGHTLLGWEVCDIKACVTDLLTKGVVFEKYTHLPQDEQGIWNSPSGAKIAWFKDPDGNTLSLTQP